MKSIPRTVKRCIKSSYNERNLNIAINSCIDNISNIKESHKDALSKSKKKRKRRYNMLSFSIDDGLKLKIDRKVITEDKASK